MPQTRAHSQFTLTPRWDLGQARIPTLTGCGRIFPDRASDPLLDRSRGGDLYLRDTLRLPAKGLCPSAHPVFQQPATGGSFGSMTACVREMGCAGCECGLLVGADVLRSEDLRFLGFARNHRVWGFVSSDGSLRRGQGERDGGVSRRSLPQGQGERGWQGFMQSPSSQSSAVKGTFAGGR